MGERRGRYEKTLSRLGEEKPQGPHSAKVVKSTLDPMWDNSAKEYFARLVANSPLAHEIAKDSLARTVVDSELQIRELMAMEYRNADEHRALTQAHARKQKALEGLRLTDKTADEGGEL